MNNIWIIAQGDANSGPSGIRSKPVTDEQGETTAVTQSDANNAGAQDRPQQGLQWTQFLLPIMIFVVMYLMLFRGPRKKQQQHKQMVQSLTKNDKVRTIGGIIGTVVDIKGDEITLKVDESNNTKIKVTSSAIGRNMSKDND